MLLWADGFEHYGTNTAKMLDGVYAQADGATASLAIGTTIVNSGTSSVNIG